MNIHEIVASALAEDLGTGDVTTQALFQANVPASGRIIAEEPEGLVLAGLAVAVEVFAQVDPSLTCSPSFADGDRTPAGAIVLTVAGDGRSMLKGERVALNFLQRLSGIATLTGKFCDAVQAALDGSADIILLDNMTVSAIRRAVELIKGRATVEVSGGVTLSNVRELAAAGPDLISVGALTHSASAARFSMDIVPR